MLRINTHPVHPARPVHLLFVLALVLGLIGLAPTTTHAATVSVACDYADLIAKISQANGTPEADTLTLTSGCTYTYGAATNDTDGPNALPAITSPITIVGNGAIIRGLGGGAPVEMGFRLFFVGPGGNLTLQALTVRDGNTKYGGGIRNLGTLTLANVTVRDNSVTTNGGGIANAGTLTITNSTFSGNHADLIGGGIENVGTLTMTNSTFSGNSAGTDGGGIYNDDALTVTSSTFSGNSASHEGGGIRNEPTGTLTVTNSTLSGNSASSWGGGIYNDGTLAVTNSTLSGNSSPEAGGGIANFEMATITKSTFSGNSAGMTGGGIENVGTLTVTNSAFSGNSASNQGGGMRNFGTLTMTNSTLSGNSATLGGGIINLTTTATVENTIIANSLVGSNCYGLSGYVMSDDGGNLSSDASCPFSAPSSQNSVDPKLDPDGLKDNGGPTLTIALLPGSPAIDAAVDCPPPATDQRGVARPQGKACDSGAYESQVATPVNDAPVAQNQTATTNEDTAVSLTLDASDANNDALTYTYTQPQHGKVSGSGPAVTYTPNANYNGTDSFTYTVSDGNGGEDTATVTITVQAVNDAPVAMDDSYTTNEDTPLTINTPGVLSNDTDADGNALTAQLLRQPSNGAVTLNANGSFTYTPNANFSGSDSFTYTVSDGNGGEDTAAVTITVQAVNNAPVARNDSATTNEDTATTISVLANDSDVDGDVMTVALQTAPTHGSATLNADGSFSYTPTANYNGPDSFTYQVCDPSNACSQATVSLTINAVNDAPTIAVAAGGQCRSDTSGLMKLTLADVDSAASSLTLAATSSNTNLVPVKNVVFDGTGANRSATITIERNKTGSATITLTVSDGQASTTTTITVQAGGNGNDTLTGTDDADMLFGQNGDDTLTGKASNDVLCGGNGDDSFTGGTGADSFDGGKGTDRVSDFNSAEGDIETNMP